MDGSDSETEKSQIDANQEEIQTTDSQNDETEIAVEGSPKEIPKTEEGPNMEPTAEAVIEKPAIAKKTQLDPIRTIQMLDNESAVTVNIRYAPGWDHQLWSGGFRHKSTGVVYVNSAMMTDPPLTEEDIRRRNVLRFTRETQTKEVKRKETQTFREAGTQMARPGVHVDSQNDKTIMSQRVYETAEEWAERRRKAATRIQCFARKFFARRQLEQLREEERIKFEQITGVELKTKRLGIAQTKKEVQRRRNPYTKEDFAQMLKEINEWREREAESIRERYPNVDDEERKNAFVQLLHKETKLLHRLEQLKLENQPRQKAERIDRTFATMAASWKISSSPKGDVVAETERGRRAQMLWDIHSQLTAQNIPIEARLEVLDTVKELVEEHVADSPLCSDILELVKRECDLLGRRMDEKKLVGLRQRITNLFLQFVECPEFNPAAKMTKKKTTNVK